MKKLNPTPAAMTISFSTIVTLSSEACARTTFILYSGAPKH